MKYYSLLCCGARPPFGVSRSPADAHDDSNNNNNTNTNNNNDNATTNNNIIIVIIDIQC